MKDNPLDQLTADSDPEALVTRWVLVGEIMSPDGKRSLARTWSESCMEWDVQGLLNAGLDETYWNDEGNDDA